MSKINRPSGVVPLDEMDLSPADIAAVIVRRTQSLQSVIAGPSVDRSFRNSVAGSQIRELVHLLGYLDDLLSNRVSSDWQRFEAKP